MELIVQWLLWTLAYIFFIVELNLYLDYDWRRKNKPRAEKLAHLIAYFGGFFLFLKFVVPFLD
jgi:hypothetical protein|tara:strand:+ start:4866 stop:5054 length:189 start_codon:yes stop_codon:yes gene_type:complete